MRWEDHEKHINGMLKFGQVLVISGKQIQCLGVAFGYNCVMSSKMFYDKCKIRNIFILPKINAKECTGVGERSGVIYRKEGCIHQVIS